MLTFITHWMYFVGAFADAALLLRILQLRLNRTYLFITLDSLLSVFYDGVFLWFGVGSPVNDQVFLYSRLLMSLLQPAIASDIFEEIKQLPAAKQIFLFRFQRMLFGLIAIGLFGLLYLFATDLAASARTMFLGFGIMFWAGAAASMLLLLIMLRRDLRKAGVSLPENTATWLIYYVLLTSGALVSTAISLSGLDLTGIASDVVNIVFVIYNLGCVLWCIVRLKRIPSNGSLAIVPAD